MSAGALGARISGFERNSEWYPRAALVVVVLLFVGLTSLVAVKTPAWEASDEPSHVQNVETLVAGHWYRIPPVFASHDGPLFTAHPLVPQELHQPPLYYLLLAGFQRLAGVPAHAVKPGRATFVSTRGFYRHHSAAQHRFLLLLRFPNVVFGALAIWLTFLAARLLTDDRWTPVIAAATVAFLPRFVFLSAFVTNDNLVNLLGAALTYSALRSVRSPAWRWPAVVGGVIGLLVITKLSAVPAAAVLIPVALARKGWLRRGQAVALAAVAALVVCGWYLIQNDVRYGDIFAISASQHYLTNVAGNGNLGAPYAVSDPLRLVFEQVPVRIWNTFWYQSDWNQFQWPGTTSLIFWLILAFALAGLVRRRAVSATKARRPERIQLAVVTVLAIAGFLAVLITAFSTKTYEARLAFVGLPALACLAALGLERWRPPVRAILPLAGLCGTLIAIQQNVLSVNWYH